MTPGLEELCLQQLVGVERIEYVYLSDVDPDSLHYLVDPATWNRPYGVQLLEGGWRRLPVLPVPRWLETSQSSEQGTAYRQQVRCRTPRMKPAAARVFDQLSRKRLLLRITDRDGTKWGFGSGPNSGFRLEYRAGPGGAGQFAGYQVQLEGLTRASCAGWNPYL